MSTSGIMGAVSVGKMDSANGFRPRKAGRLKEEEVMG